MHALVNLVVPEGSVAVHWFEQSSFAIKDAQGSILQIDPYFPHDRPGERFIHPEPPLEEAELPTHAVLLTHAHGDHTCSESIERIWQTALAPSAEAPARTRFIGPKESIKQILSDTSVEADYTVTIQAGEAVELGTMTAHAVYAKPPEGDPAANIAPPDVTHLGYLLKAGGVTLYFSGDPINTFADHDALIEPIAAHEPHIGFLTNHPTEGEFPFFAGCVKMAQRLGLKHAVPAHYACFVKRDYDPQEWAAQFPEGGPKPLIIPRNTHIIYPG